MATATPRSKKATTVWCRRRVSPLVIVIPLLTLIVTAFILVNGRTVTEPRPFATLSTQDFHALAWSRVEANTVFFGHHDGMLISRDGGATWQFTALKGVDAMNLAFAPTDPQQMYAAGHGAFYRSQDSGTTWESMAGPLQTADIHAFAISPDDANRMYAFVTDQGLLASSDGGRTWQPIAGAPTRVTALAAGPGQSVYVGGIQGNIFTSTDSGITWQQENIGMAADVTSIMYDPQSQNVIATAVMAGSNQGMLHKRSARGGNWSMTALNGMGAPMTLTMNPSDATILLLVNNRGQLYRSTDGGVTWGNT